MLALQDPITPAGADGGHCSADSLLLEYKRAGVPEQAQTNQRCPEQDFGGFVGEDVKAAMEEEHQQPERYLRLLETKHAVDLLLRLRGHVDTGFWAWQCFKPPQPGP